MSQTSARWVIAVLVLSSVAGLCATGPGAGAQPAESGSVSLLSHAGGVVNAVRATPDYLLWAKGGELAVYSPDGAERIGSILLPDVITDIALDGDRAYLSAGQGWLYVIDLSDPAQPSLLQHVTLPGFDSEFDALTRATSVAARDGHAFVALYEGGLWAVDLNQPSPTSVQVGPYLWKVRLAGNYLLGLDTPEVNTGYTVWDVSDPANPQNLGSVSLGDRVLDVQVVGNYLYAADQFGGLKIYAWDPADPLNPALVAQVPLELPVTAVTVTSDGRYAFVAAGNGLAYLDLANPASPVERPGVDWPFDFYAELATSGNYIFAANRTAGLPVFTFDASGARFVRRLGLPGRTQAGTLHNGQLYLAQGSQGLARMELTNAGNPRLADIQPVGGPVYDLALVGSNLALGANAHVVVINPGTLEVLGSASLPDRARHIAATAEVAFVAVGEAGVCAVSLADPGAPEQLQCLDTEGEAQDVALAGETLYVADSANGVLVLDVTNPAAMQVIGQDTGATAYSVALVNGQLFVGDLQSPGRVLILIPGTNGALAPAGEITARGVVYDVVAAGERLYLADGEGLLVLERQGDNWAEWASYDTAGGAYDLIVSGDVIYLMDGDNGLVTLSAGALAPDTPVPGGTPTAEAPGNAAFTLFLPVLLR